MNDDLPQPVRRKKTPDLVVVQLLKFQGGRCAHCQLVLAEFGESIRIVAAWEVDHIQAIWALGTNDPGNLQLLCPPCHKVKSRKDNKEAKKGRRIRGELKPKPKTNWPSGRKIPSRPFNR